MSDANRLLIQDERARARSLRHPWVTRARFEARSIAGQHRLYASYLHKKHRALGWSNDDILQASVVDRDTELVLEAFPRSGNTFALAAFVTAQANMPRIGHHVCYPAQVLAAVHLHVPVLVIARDPRQTIASALQWNPLFSARQWIRAYTRYFERVEGIARRSGRVMVVDFGEVTRDFGAVMLRMNALFDTAFTPFVHTEENVAACYRLIESNDEVRFGTITEDRVSRPSEQRRSRADDLAAELRQEAFDRVLLRAERAHRAVLAASAA